MGAKQFLLKSNLFFRIYTYIMSRWFTEKLSEGQRGIFIDCGAYDGCSALKFMIANPSFSSVSFEPNPELWDYYDGIPTTLIKKGVSKKKEILDFFVDHVDADGSSTIPSKAIIFGNPEENSKCEKICISCESLPDFIAAVSNNFDKIVLKLDVEGAEYDILEELLRRNLVQKISKLYAEFHWEKCGFSRARHDKLVKALKARIPVRNWDAIDLAVHHRGPTTILRRKQLIAKSFTDIKKYQNLTLHVE
jgi:FkbM family methyltransferase